MDISSIVIAFCTVIGTAISIFTLLSKKFDKIDKKFDKIDEKFDKIDAKLEKIILILNQQGQRLSKLEGYIEGRENCNRKTGTEEK